MPAHTVLVIGNPALPHFKELSKLPEETTIAVGTSVEAFENTVSEADIILVHQVTQEPLRTLMRRAPKLRWIHAMSVGLDSLLSPELIESPIPLTNSRGVYSRSLAEFCVAGMLYFSKDLPRMLRSKAAHRWDQFDVEELYGQTLTIVGYGSIGHACAKNAHMLGMKVIAVRRRPDLSKDDELVQAVYPMEARAEAMAAGDYVLAAAPLTPETKGLISEPEFRAMKRTGVIMNLGRGPVIDEKAMIRALSEGWIRGAALDVYEKEPLGEDHPLWDMPNVLMSPHCSDHTPTWMIDSMQLFLQNFERFDKGQPLLNVADKHAGY